MRQIIEQFALKCRNSWQYQGDGFGIAYFNEDKKLKILKSLKPIWAASDLIQKIPYTDFVLVHARSAFGENTIGDLDNNQPFGDKDFLFAFNGNLQGMRLKMEGKIGSHKIYNFFKNKIKKNPNLSFETLMKQNTEYLCKKAKYVKSFNLIAVKGEEIYIHNQYGAQENANYFDMWVSQKDKNLIVSSERLDYYDMQIKPEYKGLGKK